MWCNKMAKIHPLSLTPNKELLIGIEFSNSELQKQIEVTHFDQVFHFYTPWIRQKIFRFVTFWEGINMEHWTKKG